MLYSKSLFYILVIIHLDIIRNSLQEYIPKALDLHHQILIQFQLGVQDANLLLSIIKLWVTKLMIRV